jgi:hypothetical protein
MNVVLPEMGTRLAESLYDEVMEIACDLRGLLRGGLPSGTMTPDHCLSYVRATGSVTTEVISLICWACAYRAVQGRDMEIEPFMALARELGQSKPVGAGVPGPGDDQCLMGLDLLRHRVDQVSSRIRRLETATG